MPIKELALLSVFVFVANFGFHCVESYRQVSAMRQENIDVEERTERGHIFQTAELHREMIERSSDFGD